jgi:DNA-binding beta-propeller fold protein YncE
MDAMHTRRPTPARLYALLAAAAVLFTWTSAGSSASERLGDTEAAYLGALPVGERLTASKHLYVLDSTARTVLRFPLNAGLPSQQPDAVLTGFSRPLGIAVGPNDGRFYVDDAGAAKLDIYEPAPNGASHPSHILSLAKLAKRGNGHGLGALAVDQFGFVYIGYMTITCADVCTTNANIAVFKALPSGTEEPFTHLLFPPGPFVVQLSVNQQQQLAASWPEAGGPNVASGLPRELDNPSGSYAAAYHYGVAWDPAGRLYVTDFGEKPGDASTPPVRPQVDVVPNWQDCPYNVFGKGCSAEYAIYSTTERLDQPRGVAYDGGHLYVSSALDKSVGSARVFVFDPTKGAQIPETILGGPSSRLTSAYDIAVGP